MEEPGPPLTRRPRSDSTRSSDRIALGSALAGGLLAAVLVAASLAFSRGQPAPSTNVPSIAPTDQPVQVPAQQPPVRAASSSAASATPRSAATATSPAPRSTATELAHIANTDGQGVVLRASPRDDDRTPRGFEDGDAVTVLERSGSDWARVRGGNGQEGWVPTRYLGP